MLDAWSVFVLTLPLLLLIGGAVCVIVVALCKAAPSDIPAIMSVSCAALGRIADGVRRHNGFVQSSVMLAGPEPLPPNTEVSAADEEVDQ